MKLSSRHLSVAAALSSLANILLFLAVWRMNRTSQEYLNPQEQNFQYTKQPEELPTRINPTTRLFHNPDSAFPIADDAKWATIVPHHRGFIRLGSSGVPFSIATYHQLHCINTVRFAYRVARDGLFQTAHAREDAFHHANHCVNVLRQALLCKADTTIWAAGEAENATVVTRRCGNSAQVMDFVRENQAFWEGVPYGIEDAVNA